MVGVAHFFLALVTCVAIVQAINSSNVSTTTVTTTVTETATGSLTQETITGDIVLAVNGSCDLFSNHTGVMTAIQHAIATVANVSSSYVSVTLSHSCSNRRLVGRWHSRRLDGAVTAAYIITLPPGSTISGDSVSSLINSTNTSSLTATLSTAMSDAGATGFTVTVTSISAPSVTTVQILGSTTTTNTTTMPLQFDDQVGFDSSALTRTVLRSAQVWTLLAVIAASKFF
mmetsp:Transcript_72844/g.161105  ORF Transcript_72844/g.161105 Transcript_72844/m.161105 type:complete len:229 (+) Transcript_72844:106-792(+)